MGASFLLGVGAQKAGTSWLHNYLSNHDCVNFGFAKEYHIFDALTLPECCRFKNKAQKQALDLLVQDYEAWRNAPVLKRLCFMSDTQLYFDYFSGLLAGPGCKLTGDITPTYSGLSVDTLQFIKTNFSDRGIRVRPVFLMRDPVARLQSMVRMQLVRREKKRPTADKELQQMYRMHLSDQDLLRVNYPTTIAQLEEVFGDDVFFEFYETFFTEASIRRLCSFLRLDYIPPDFNTRVYSNDTGNTISDTDLERFSLGYGAIYDFCSQKFGAEKVEQWWRRR